jgi:serine/threonine protein kinase
MLLGQILVSKHGHRYEVQQQLGKNAGRRTLLARDLESQELVIIKLLNFSSDFEWTDLKLFEREAETLKTLDHPHIPRYIDYFDIDLPEFRGFALVQSYITGQSLQDVIKAGRTFSTTEVKQIAKALLEILIYLHDRNPPVIHRDIKPSNIMLSGAGNIGDIYLVDFGSVQTIAATESGTITVVGTYGYMPPEQFGGRTVPASDLYSLGATLIALITGKHPADLPQKELRIQFEELVSLSPAITFWLRKMTEPGLDRRFTSAQSALQALSQHKDSDYAPLMAQKPSGSRVSLRKSDRALEILIPPTGFGVGVVFLIFFAIFWNTFIVTWTAGALKTSLWFALFSLPFWVVGVGLAATVLFILFGHVRLRLNQERIALSYELIGFTFNTPRPTQRSYISKLEHKARSFTKDSDGDRIEIKPKIIIWAGVQKYELGGDLLSDPELEWLAHELSDWLGLPIERA